MRERRYRGASGGSRDGRTMSRASRGYNPPRHREYATHDARGMETYAQEAEGSRRIRKDDHFGRDFDSRSGKVSDYDDRDRDRFGVHIGSPRRIDQRDHLDRDRPSVRQSRRLHNEDQNDMDAFPPDFNRDFRANGSRRSNHEHVGHTSFYAAGDADRNRDGSRRDYYLQSRYSDEGGAVRLPKPECLDGARQVSVDYEREGRMRSGSYALDNDSRGGVTRSNLETDEFGRAVSSVEVGYFHMQNKLLLKKRDEAFHDKDKSHLEINGFDHFQNGPYQDEVGRETSRYMMEENLLSSRGYVKRDSDFFYSLSHSEEYASSTSGILRENFPGRSTAHDIHMRSDVVQQVSLLASEPTTFNGYSEKQHYMSPGRPVDRRKDISCSKPNLLPGEKHEDHLYAEYGRSEIDSIRPREEEEYRHRHISSMGDDGPQYSSSHGRSISDKFHEHRSLHGRKRDHNMFASGRSHLEYGSEITHGYGSMKHGEYPAEVVSGPLSPRPRGYEPSFARIYDSPRKRLSPQERCLGEPSERRLEYEHFNDDMFIRHSSITTAEDGNNTHKLYSQVNGGDEIERVHLRKKHEAGKLNNERKRMPSQRNNHLPFPAKFFKSRSGNTLRSDSGNMNRPLGHVPRKLNLSQRLGKSYRTSAKKRLGPAAPTK